MNDTTDVVKGNQAILIQSLNFIGSKTETKFNIMKVLAREDFANYLSSLKNSEVHDINPKRKFILSP